MSPAIPATDAGTATAAQRRVCEALSRLYLDSDSRDDDDSIAHVLATSPFTLEQLRTMLLHEVHPVLIGHLRSAAGVWHGFDPDSLAAMIQARCARRWGWPARWYWRSDARAQWALLAPKISALGATATY
ncbi:DUF7079 family protein [Xanthomonas vasicola]|uniref:DUF7079 domain-containing protein n=2 Tax=Xanthomonas vasicola TaxID=56459 RepID=A0A836ZRW6_XANVA|nr:hypothetical protein [Xanthomonas vasicola]KEZ97923.1 hypothetical protein A11M_0108385 [Xanthomonas vasicola pv. vasculorum NCPPB 895]KFA29489.1 hypothetical protein KW5_0107295 [Xanthomonas vasicola pv. vasculorum NCPPB 1326]MBV6744652.1 hypothetical protein [Xanthomonas vasicola pv. vasculorum NCPPB 890]MBV6890265.1 hypothetical protein [Xanthomonas vasicola pv. vasculorum]MBV7303193.1 hypothetical protein [Xanthomonas vasicola pv. vasculorum]